MNNTIEVLEELKEEFTQCINGKHIIGESEQALTEAIATLKAVESAADELPEKQNGNSNRIEIGYTVEGFNDYRKKAIPILAKQILKIKELRKKADLMEQFQFDAKMERDRCVIFEGKIKELEAKYNELIMAVGKKWKDETRHQTALRYIRQAEECNTGAGEVKIKEIEKSISDVLTQRDMWKTDYAELKAENKKLKEQQLTEPK